MATKVETTERMICDLCGRETNKAETVTLYRTDNKIAGARMAASSLLRSDAGQGQANVDICGSCQQRPVGDVVALMYPPQPRKG